jgi:hypothetical protein
MATTNISSQCYSCYKETRTFLCQGCEHNFCFDDLTKHLQDLHKELETIENDHDQFRQIINDQKENPDQYSLIKQIDQWENDSINKIKQTAKECREQVTDFRNKYLTIFENKLNNFVKKIKEIRPKNQFNEFDLNQIKRELKKINKEFEKPKTISIEQDSSRFIHQIFVVLPIDGGNSIRYSLR